MQESHCLELCHCLAVQHDVCVDVHVDVCCILTDAFQMCYSTTVSVDEVHRLKNLVVFHTAGPRIPY